MLTKTKIYCNKTRNQIFYISSRYDFFALSFNIGMDFSIKVKVQHYTIQQQSTDYSISTHYGKTQMDQCVVGQFSAVVHPIPQYATALQQILYSHSYIARISLYLCVVGQDILIFYKFELASIGYG